MSWIKRNLYFLIGSAVALVLIDGMTYRDAADVMGVPIGTLTSRLARARETLAKRVLGDFAKD